MLCVVRGAADSPEVSTHGLFATGGVLLREEILLVLRDLAQIVRTGLHSSLNGGETSASGELKVAQRSRTFVRFSIEDEEASAIRVLGRLLTVSTDEVRTTGVTFLDGGFCQTTLYIINTGSILNFSHKSEF